MLVQHTEKILTWLENLLQILPIYIIILSISIDIKIDVNVGAEALKSIELGRPLWAAVTQHNTKVLRGSTNHLDWDTDSHQNLCIYKQLTVVSGFIA